MIPLRLLLRSTLAMALRLGLDRAEVLHDVRAVLAELERGELS